MYETVGAGKILEEAIEMLNFDQPANLNAPPVEYKNMIVSLISQFPMEGVGESASKEHKGLLWNLYLFFDILDCDDFYTFCDARQASIRSDDTGEHEPAIDKVYRETLQKVKNKLRLLENV